MTHEKITVAVCTHNRCDSLARLLRSFCELRTPDNCEIEFLVVANKCTDNTAEVLSGFSSSIPITVCVEDELGIAAARNAVIDNASGHWVVWTDDDLTVGKDWVIDYHSAMGRYDGSAFFGAPIEPVFEGDTPDWIEAAVRHSPSAYAKLMVANTDKAFTLADNDLPYGANMAIRMAVLRQFRFETALGRKGQGDLTGGEEVLLFRQLLASGYHGWWLQKPVVTHWIDEGRQTIDYLKDYWYAVGLTENTLDEARNIERSSNRNWSKKLSVARLRVQLAVAQLTGDPDKWLPVLCNLMLEKGRLANSLRRYRQ
ncbi:MAG: glycosyltransferase family 2 protein [Pseudomonadota bacterium]